MKYRTVFTWCFVVALVLSSISALFFLHRSESKLIGNDWDATRKVIEVTVARIDYESTNRGANPSEKTLHNGSQTSAVSSSAADIDRDLVDGYSLSSFYGEMEKGILDRDAVIRKRTFNQAFEWLEDPRSIKTLVAQADEAGRDWSFGLILLDDAASLHELRDKLEQHDIEIAGSSGRFVRAKLPGDERLLTEITEIAEVEAVAAIPSSAKISETAHVLLQQTPHESMPVFITLMDSDPNGHWRRSLEVLGVTVGEFDPTIRVYPAHATYQTLLNIVAADFVAAIEPIRIVETSHDSSVPAMGADALRTYDSRSGLFMGIGGASVPIAVMDSGLNRNHLDISSNRASICGANFIFTDPLLEDTDLWIDERGHGTHVTGTMIGNGTVRPQYAGIAPLVQHVRFAKVLNRTGRGTSYSVFRGMDYLKLPIACSSHDGATDALKPAIVSMSLSHATLDWEGRDAPARKLDAVVWHQRQLYVVSQSNRDIHGFSNYGAAKNSLPVGAIRDDGSAAHFSSRGPTADGRLTPLVVGSGVDVTSTSGNRSRAGYTSLNGTSMSTPAVAGVAALVMDTLPSHREHPALTRARLLASAIKADAWMDANDAYRRDNSNGPGALQVQYGLGKVSARTSVLQRDQSDGWQNGSAIADLREGEFKFIEIHVAENSARLDVVLTWDEPPADTLSNTVLNDLDLWIDRDGDCESEPCGEYASRSSVDNVEWITILNPEPGLYRTKIAAMRVYTEPPRAAVAWTVIRDRSTPNLEIVVDREDISVQEVELTIGLLSDAYVAAGTRLHFDCRTVSGTPCGDRVDIELIATREDGIERHVNLQLGDEVDVGELAVGEAWQASVTYRNLANDDMEGYNLYVKANAWNAKSALKSVLVRKRDPSETSVEEPLEPANSEFANATTIEGEIGNTQFDLLLATTEPGEPLFTPTTGFPSGSVWYKWVASSNEKVSFSVTPLDSSVLENEIRLDAFQDAPLSDLDQIASSPWGIQFFAEADQTYFVRISHSHESAPLMLNWAVGPRPINDRFVAAVPLSGDEGNVLGTNSGATMESSENFGELVASVWYRWVAPNDGTWRFELDHDDLQVLVFSGERLPDLRLVSGLPTNHATVKVRGDDVYWVAVTSANSFSGGRIFELQWRSETRMSSNDDFSNAEEIPEHFSSPFYMGIEPASSVEPGEPLESGVRTEWFRWRAPDDSSYTWRIEELRGTSLSLQNHLMVSVFSGTGLDDLRLVGTNGTRMAGEFTFPAKAGVVYWISVGIPQNDYLAFHRPIDYYGVFLVWGRTPVNDEASHALQLAGDIGSVTGSLEFATSSPSERIDLFGRSTVWWNYEAQETGWLRFTVDGVDDDWALTVHDNTESIASDDTMLASDLWQRSENEIRLFVEAGSVYTVALGHRQTRLGGEFTLRWEFTEAPKWLRYVDQFVDGDRSMNGERVLIRNPADMVIHPNDRYLYLATDAGLQVFERDVTTGELGHVQLVESEIDATSGTMLWDEPRDRLLLHQCESWYSYKSSNEGRELVYEGRISHGIDDHCSFLLLPGNDGSSIYGIDQSNIGHFVVNAEGELTLEEAHRLDREILSAVLTNDGAHLFTQAPFFLYVYSIDRDSGTLTRTEYDAQDLYGPMVGRSVMAITDDDAFLFALDDDGQKANVFSLEDPSQPEWFASLPAFWEPQVSPVQCEYADVRDDDDVVDVFCRDLIFTFRWDREERLLRGESWLHGATVDSFNHPLPDWDELTGFGVSQDDRFLYTVAANGGVVILSRELVSTRPVDGPDLAVNVAAVDDARYEPGVSFELNATISNHGDSVSDASTLRFYQSENEVISSADTLVGTVAVSSIDVSGQISESIRLMAPVVPDSYFYGACVDRVSDENILDNNCSASVTVTVAEAEEGPDLAIQAATVNVTDVATGTTITLQASVSNNGDAQSVSTVLRYLQSSDETIAPDDSEIATTDLEPIAAGASVDVERELSASSEAGTYYYGVCVDAVVDEMDTENNCSDGVRVNVSDR